MNGFGDDQNTLEDNPFANPFASNSNNNSLDPWSSPYQQQFTDDFDSQAAFGGESSLDRSSSNTPVYEDHQAEHSQETKQDELTPVEPETKSDPLDSAAVNAEDEEDQPESAKSPGFREAGFSQTATIRPTAPEEYDPPPVPRTPTPPPHTSPPVSPPPTLTHDHPSAIHGNDAEWGPLNQQTEQTFPNLALGGEISSGGWHTQGESSSSQWANDPRTFSRFPTEDEDSDDDKPIGEILKKSPPVGSSATSSPILDKTGLPPTFIISVDDPQKVGDPIRSFTMYTVHTRTTSPLYQKSAFSVLRRYSDFLWLYETLSLNNPGVVVPPVPEKNPFGRFDDTFVKQRRLALEKCIQKIANHPVLCKDSDLKLFLESDTFSLDIKHRKAEIAHERGGLMASIGQAVVGPKFYETDEWFDKKKFYLDSLESQLRGLVKAIDLVSKQRAELSQATSDFAKSAADLSSSDIGAELSQALAGLAEVEEKAMDLQVIQSDQDMVTLMSTADEYARLINSVRLAFNSRIRIYHQWRNAEAESNRTKQNHERNRAQGRIPPERLSWSLSQIAEAERRAVESKREFETVSKLAKSEVARFEKERIEDFKNSLHAFLEGMIERQKELIGAWEKYQHLLLRKVGGGRGLPAQG